MRALDVVAKKRDGNAHSFDEIHFLISGYLRDEIPEYQISAWLMAVFLKGMNFAETGFLTRVMIESGDVFDLSSLTGPKIDKHSTGGVGDKTSLIIAPVVAACGVKVPMMSGRSLGHTGGTLDKLDTIPGYKTLLDQEDFVRAITSCGFAMTGQTQTIVPADRRLYALRDVTATVESIPLITASILSKKFAEGASGFVFDVKTGSGAFMKSKKDSLALAESLVNTAATLKRQALAFITDMSFPLGTMVGNFLEVEESYRCLSPGTTTWEGQLIGKELRLSGPSAELMELSLELSAGMLMMANDEFSREKALQTCLSALTSGKALESFESNLQLQGGHLKPFKSMIGSYRAPIALKIVAEKDGFLQELDALQVGKAGVLLGVGRNRTDDKVLPDVGVEIHTKRGEKLTRGQEICTVYAQSERAIQEAAVLIRESIVIAPIKPDAIRLVQEVVRQS